MPKVNDVESLLDQVQTILAANLNTKIDAITAEKADTIALEHVNTDAYCFQSLNDKVMAYDPFILYGLEEVATEGIGPATMKKYRINVVVCVSDSGQDSSIGRRMLRYSRALEETCNTYFAALSSGAKLSVESLTPVPFSYGESDYQAVGVSIVIGIA